MRTHILNYLLVSVFSVLLISCGGGSTQTAGIGGTGITSSGSITGFGSIFVNGVEYETGSNTNVTLNGSGVQVTDLKLGMTVTVRGTLNQDKITGSANTVMITSELEGPVGATPVEDTTNNSKTFSVLGRTIIANPATVFDGSAFDYTSIDQNDVIEVSGYINNSGALLATRIEKKGTLAPGVTQVEVTGTILNATKVLSSVSFELDVNGTALVITHNGTTDFATLVGQTLIVKGVFNNNTAITASEINIKDNILDNQDSDVEIEGIITNYVSDSSFMVNGQRIDASAATLSPANLVLANNVKVEVEGTLNTGNILIASEIESKTAEFQLTTTVSAVTPASNTITLTYNGSTIDIIVNNNTTLEDETSSNALTINNISIGDYLEIEALRVNNNVIALSVHRKSMGSAASLKGTISAIDTSTTGEESVTILNIIYPSNNMTVFKEDEETITRDAFLIKIMAAPTVVKITDNYDYIGGSLDGIADEMEIDN